MKLEATAWRLSIFPGQVIAECVAAFPAGHWGGAARVRNVRRSFDDLHSMDIARAIGEDVARAHPHDRLRLGVVLPQRIVEVQRSIAVYPQPLPRLEIDEQQADRRIRRDVAEALEHAVAVVARESKRVRRHDPDESGRAALVRAI